MYFLYMYTYNWSPSNTGISEHKKVMIYVYHLIGQILIMAHLEM